MTTKTSDYSGFAIIGLMSSVALLLALNTVCFAFVAVKLWAWFVVPAFNAPPLTMVTAAGIDLLVNCFRPPTSSKTEDEDVGTIFLKGLGRIVAICAFLLTIGWFIHLFA